jgi:hypothetical protein
MKEPSIHKRVPYAVGFSVGNGFPYARLFYTKDPAVRKVFSSNCFLAAHERASTDAVQSVLRKLVIVSRHALGRLVQKILSALDCVSKKFVRASPEMPWESL